ncbi:uncharacterized protein LOC132260884 isoform X2 [Phlebotomus argentipes]|uniref:uncharacterized protein LOC132260884 isoform X2 n=1 Tax=Phlebotomus argentipes TaxID=94469 RepID=UPI00289355C1|nr:uncharacterized protein LOC132260884 isoform X2 [Phlebotomus argentipes]
MATEFEGIPSDLADGASKDGPEAQKKDEENGSEIVLHIPIKSHESGSENDRHFPDISEQINPMSPLKAVQMSGEHETLLSDDETPKILTELEPVKKKQESAEIDEQQENSEEKEDVEAQEDPESIARKQLETLNTLHRRKGRPKADEPRAIDVLKANASKKIQILENRVLPSADDLISGLRNINRQSRSLHSNILTREELTREIIQKCRKSSTSIEKVSQKSVPKRREEFSGTIEIPQELILSAEDTTPLLVQESESLEGEDLLAILEGDDEDGQSTSIYEVQSQVPAKSDDNMRVEEFTISLITDPAKKKEMDKEREVEIAMKQIMSLPVKPKGRRPRKTESNNSVKQEEEKPRVSASDLVSSLVSDWSDNEDKADELMVSSVQGETPETTVEVVVSSAQSSAPPVPLKSSRIIKKKVIWDPDAPETQFSYASKVQSKRQQPKVLVVEERSSVLPTKNVKRSPEVQPRASGGKKRKLTEIDKLLGDEGAVNMIYSLERENNNQDVPEIVTKPDKNQMVSKYKEKNALVERARAVKKVVIKQMDSGTPRGRPKREATSVQVSPPTPAKKTPTKKRTSARDSSSASESWDYIYSTPQGDDSMIIRRRSNSSYSGSTTSPRRLSIDQHNFEFAKPVDKKTPKMDPNAAQNLVAELKGKLNQAISRGVTIRNAEVRLNPVVKIVKDVSVKLRASERKLGNVEFKELTIRRYDNFVQVIFSSTFGTLKNVLTIGLLREVKTALNILKEDSKTKLVLVTSSGNNFCQGIDFSSLIQSSADKRKSAAQQLSTALMEFLDALSIFPKPLLAGVHGTASDLGVTMLPLFDVVLSSEAATFRTNYAKIGQIPEANAALNLSGKVSAKGAKSRYHTVKWKR